MIYILLILCFFSCITTNILLHTYTLEKTNNKIDNLNIGKIEGQTLCNYLLNSFQNLDDVIGKGNNDKTLTKQNKDLQKSLDKLNSLLKQQYAEDRKRLIQYTDDQRETARAINDFTLFMESWTKTVAENNDLKIQLSSMQQQIHLLDHKIDELEKQNHIFDNSTSHDNI